MIKLDLTWEQFKRLLALSLEYPELHELLAILENKLHRMVEHDLYTKYKTASSEAEREEARQKYLDDKGIPQEFRW